MSLRERAYSVLVVSSAEGFNDALSALLPEAKCETVRFVSSISAAKRECSEHSFDYVIINSPLPDETGTRFAIDACNAKGTVVLLMVRAELHEEIYDQVAEHGVLTLSKPTSRTTIVTALNWMSSTRERLRKAEKKTLSLEDKMEEIRLVNRAKWLLISKQQMDEQTAHRYMEKQAMDRCLSKREIAREIIDRYS